MDNLHHLPTPTHKDALSKQAVEWFARLRANNITAAEQAQFKAWINTSALHQQAFNEINSFWEGSDFSNVLQDMPISADAQPLFTTRSRLPYFKYALGIAASLAITFILFRPVLNCLQADYCTAVGEIRTVSLADGSQITLNSNTALTVAYAGQQRSIQLQQGEALFEVQRNPYKPFVVTGHYSTTRVLGTRFIVREESNSDTVSVINGVVEVSHPQQKSAILKANDQIVAGQTQLGTIQHLVSDVAANWVKGRLLFDNASLNEVITEISRYRHGKVFIQNTALKTLKVSGRFDINNTDKALESLEQTLPIRIHRITPWLVVIS